MLLTVLGVAAFAGCSPQGGRETDAARIDASQSRSQVPRDDAKSAPTAAPGATRQASGGRDAATADAPAVPAAAAADSVHERGRAIYNFRCYFCHGYSGDARTLAASYLQPVPRDFTQAAGLTREVIADAVANGRGGTAMRGFRSILGGEEIAAVSAFVEREFVIRKAPNTHYHTAENGWPDHQRYAIAFPFVRGEIALDTQWEALTAEQRQGKRLYLASCITCHDRARVAEEGPAWQTRPLSSPRSEYVGNPDDNREEDEVGPYKIHDEAPKLAGLTPAQRRGKALYERDCALCHAADGTGRNWVGAFLEPPPPDFTRRETLLNYDAAGLFAVIASGKPETSMPAFATALEPADIRAVSAYVLRAFGAQHVGRGRS